MVQTVDDLIRIQMEVMVGYSWGDPRSKVEQTDENREAWEECERDIAKMLADGIMPELPHEIDVDPPRT